ncbi:MAG: SAP domain-containing protein [Oscillospiraceae bacterium]|nr:SAP domain-containing protein [Oscillospiraceae bacterium]
MTESRPDISTNLDSAVFLRYYYLKTELVQFCRQEGLQTSGGKDDLTKRISHYLDTGENLVANSLPKRSNSIQNITEDTLIESHFVCSEKHRAFFVQSIGKGFTFNVAFQKWLKSNAGKSYKDAIEAYQVIQAEKKKGKSVIDTQFEYNTYIRDFFADNKRNSLDDAIKCWKYKKSIAGHNRYEATDLIALYPEKQ